MCKKRTEDKSKEKPTVQVILAPNADLGLAVIDAMYATIIESDCEVSIQSRKGLVTIRKGLTGYVITLRRRGERLTSAPLTVAELLTMIKDPFVPISKSGKLTFFKEQGRDLKFLSLYNGDVDKRHLVLVDLKLRGALINLILSNS